MRCRCYARAGRRFAGLSATAGSRSRPASAGRRPRPCHRSWHPAFERDKGRPDHRLLAREWDPRAPKGEFTGPNFCTNLSLGGQPLYANDSDGDSVADQCSLGYTRREAVGPSERSANRLLGPPAVCCGFGEGLRRELSTTDFGDSAASLVANRCSNPRPSTPGVPLPTLCS